MQPAIFGNNANKNLYIVLDSKYFAHFFCNSWLKIITFAIEKTVAIKSPDFLNSRISTILAENIL